MTWKPSTGLPLPPSNTTVTSPYLKGAWDIRWDDPSILCGNEGFTIVGVNVYRSDATDRGPYRRINPFPVGGTFYRDISQVRYVYKEVVTDQDWVFKGNSPNSPSWVFCTKSKPVKNQPGEIVLASSPTDVVVEIDGVPAIVQAVSAADRRVTLVSTPFKDAATERIVSPVLPQSGSVVTVTYYASANEVITAMGGMTFYRVTTVANVGGTLVETPISSSPPISSAEVEKIDWIWKEAVRRNQWILQQGGERVKLFVRKVYGVPCSCGIDPVTLETNGQPIARCKICFGTGIRGGYEGPYEIIVAPDDGDRRFQQEIQGRRLAHEYEVWTGPYPVLSQRDFIVKQTNERFGIGPVRRATARGMNLQQNFTISFLDSSDTRYLVPVWGTDALAWPQTRTSDQILTGDPGMTRQNYEEQPIPTGADYVATPMGTDKGNIPDSRQQRGRTPAWANQVY